MASTRSVDILPAPESLDALRRNVEQLVEIVDRLQLQETGTSLRVLESLGERISARWVTVMLLSDSSWGKSCFLQALLGTTLEEATVPRDTGACTYLEYGREAECAVVLSHGLTARLPPEQLPEFIAKKGLASQIQQVMVRLPNPVLKSGLVVIDAPELTDDALVNGTEQTLMQGIVDAMAEADACVFIMDAGKACSETTLRFLRAQRGRLDKFHFVLESTETQTEMTQAVAVKLVTHALQQYCGIAKPRITLLSSGAADGADAERWRERTHLANAEAFRSRLVEGARASWQDAISMETARTAGEVVSEVETAIQAKETSPLRRAKMRREIRALHELRQESEELAVASRAALRSSGEMAEGGKAVGRTPVAQASPPKAEVTSDAARESASSFDAEEPVAAFVPEAVVHAPPPLSEASQDGRAVPPDELPSEDIAGSAVPRPGVWAPMAEDVTPLSSPREASTREAGAKEAGAREARARESGESVRLPQPGREAGVRESGLRAAVAQSVRAQSSDTRTGELREDKVMPRRSFGRTVLRGAGVAAVAASAWGIFAMIRPYVTRSSVPLAHSQAMQTGMQVDDTSTMPTPTSADPPLSKPGMSPAPAIGSGRQVAPKDENRSALPAALPATGRVETAKDQTPTPVASAHSSIASRLGTPPTPAADELLSTQNSGHLVADETLQAALRNWVSTFRSEDIQAQVACYAPKVDTYFNWRNVTPEQIQYDKTRAWGRVASIHKYAVTPISISDEANGRKAMLLRKDWDTTTTRGTAFAGSEIEKLVFAKLEGQWKIVDEQEVKVLKLRRE